MAHSRAIRIAALRSIEPNPEFDACASPRNDGERYVTAAAHRHRPEIREIPAASGGGVEQRAGIGLLRMGQHLRRRALFHDPAMLHHGDVVADLRRDAKIVGDEQQRDAEPGLDFVEQFEHLRLHRDVERRDRFVRDQHVGVERQRARDRDALALAAGELMRIARDRVGRQVDQFEQVARLRQRLARAACRN